MALLSAYEDYRFFEHIDKNNIDKLDIDVQLLNEFVTIDNIYDWEIGKNGIRIQECESQIDQSYIHNQIHSALYLPEVALELYDEKLSENENKQKVIDMLKNKAKCDGNISLIQKFTTDINV